MPPKSEKQRRFLAANCYGKGSARISKADACRALGDHKPKAKPAKSGKKR